MRRRLVLSVAVMSALAHLACAPEGRELAAKVTIDHVRAVRLGMTRGEVENLLGAPLAEEQQEPGHLLLTYSRRPVGVRFYPMLWVHLREGKVNEVYAKRYGFSLIDDDIGIYGLSNTSRFEGPAFSELFPH